MRRLLEWRVFLVVNVLVLFLLALSFGKEFARNYTIQREINALQSQADALSARNIEIQQLTQAIQTESFIEREARLKLGLSKPGERVVVIDDGEALTGVSGTPITEEVTTAVSASSDVVEIPEVANPLKWWYYFFDHYRFDDLLP